MNWFEVQHHNGLSIPFACDANGQLRDVLEVPRGLACGCTCPACQGPVVGKHFPSKVRRDHFAHHSRIKCKHALEASLFGMAVELLTRPGASLSLPGHGSRQEWVRDAGVQLSEKRQAAFFRKSWAIDPLKITLPKGFYPYVQKLDESCVEQPDLTAPDQKVAIHFLSYRKRYEDLTHLRFDPEWRVLAINLSYYVHLWWETCDSEKDQKIAEAKAAREQMRHWLDGLPSGRGFLFHPEEARYRDAFNEWIARLRDEEAAAREVEARMQVERNAAHAREQAKWRIPKDVPSAAPGRPVYQRSYSDKASVLTTWLASNIGMRWHARHRCWVYVGYPGKYVEPAARSFLSPDQEWVPVTDADQFS